MTQTRLLRVSLSLCLLLVLPAWSSPRFQDPYNPLDFTTGNFTTGDMIDCPPQGKGGDPDHNVLKNRDLAPSSYEPMTIQELIDLSPQLLKSQGKKHRRNWSQPALELVTEWERQGIVVEGRLIAVKSQGDESCNCGSTTDTDFHIALGKTKTSKEKNCIVVEISPRLIPTHPNWNQEKLQRLEERKDKIRVSGWMLWDANHPDHLGKFRASLWEVHPIHRFEWKDGNTWRDL
jgi:hypothetical protein